MEIYPIDFVFHIINIAVFYVIVRNLAYKPIRRFMLQREERVRTQLSDAEAAVAQAGELREEYERHLAAVEKDCELLKAEKHDEALKEALSIVDAANDEAARIIAHAHETAENQAGVAMNEAKAALAATAIDLAGKVLCFNEAARANAMAMNTRLEGSASGTVRCCGQVSEDEAAEIRRCLENLSGRHLELSFVNDESLLGGFEAFIEGQVYDFSYLAQLREAHSAVL